MGAYTTITSKGQLTIPRDVRDALGIEAGMQFYVTIRDGEVVAMPKNQKLADLAGMLGKPPSGKSLTLEEIDRSIMEAVSEDDVRIRREWGSDET